MPFECPICGCIHFFRASTEEPICIECAIWADTVCFFGGVR